MATTLAVAAPTSMTSASMVVTPEITPAARPRRGRQARPDNAREQARRALQTSLDTRQ